MCLIPRGKGKGEWGWHFLYMLNSWKCWFTWERHHVLCAERETHADSYLFLRVCVCVCATFEFSVSTVYVNGYVGLRGVVVTLTEGLS